MYLNSNLPFCISADGPTSMTDNPAIADDDTDVTPAGNLTSPVGTSLDGQQDNLIGECLFIILKPLAGS